MNSSTTANNATKKIKSFQYLDVEKMYSISSQIFSGLTEYVLKSKQNSTEESTSQKGDFRSGRILADIIEESSGTTEKRFLHDYSYTLFEEALTEAGRVLEINEDNVITTIDQINDTSFIKVTGKVLFNDVKQLIHTIKNFNDFGYAIWYITTGHQMDQNVKDLKQQADNIIDRNKRAARHAHIDAITKFKPLIEKAGLNMDPEFLKQLAYALEYGYSEQFEVQMPMYLHGFDYLFSSVLKREMLKEREEFLIKKFSRETEKAFTIFGIPTQTQQEKLNTHRDVGKEDILMKEAIMNMGSQLTKVENTFIGNLNYEYVIDPIAIYIEI